MSESIIPQPKSKFYKVKCSDCGNEQVIFSHAKTRVLCTVCGAMLAEPRGGKAKILAEILESYY